MNDTDLTAKRRRRGRRVASRRYDGWERLREKPTTAIRNTPGVGVHSGFPGDDITASGPTGETVTMVGGGTLGGVVSGRPGATYDTTGSFGAVKKLPTDADHDGWIYEGSPKRRFVGVQAVVEGAEAAARAIGGARGSRRRERKPGSGVAVSVADTRVPQARRTAEGERIADVAKNTVEALSDEDSNVTVPVKPDYDILTRYGRPPRKPEQELTEQGRELRRSRQRSFRRSVKPKGLRPETSIADLKESGMKTTAERFGIEGRTLHQPNISPERAAVYDRIAHSMVYGDADNPIDLPVSDEPTMHIMGGGPASGKTYLRQAGFFDIPDRSEAAHIDIDEGRMMLPEYDDMLRDMGGDLAATEALSGVNHHEATHVGRVATDLAMRNGHDVVLDSTGDGGPDAFVARLRQARESGYKVKGHFATTSLTKALEAAKKRAKEERRGVDPKELIDTHVDVTRAVLFGLKEGLFDELTLVDNQDFDNPVVFAEYKAGLLTVHNMEMWDAFIKKAVQEQIFYPHDYFKNNPIDPKELERLRAKAATVPKLTGKNAARVKEQGKGTVVVLAPDGKTVWYTVTAEDATPDDYRKMLAKEPPTVPMKINDDALYRVRSGRLEPHIPDLPPDGRIPVMTRREIRLAAMTGKPLAKAGIADTEAHRKEYGEIRESVLSMLKEGIQPEVQAHLVEAMAEDSDPG